jgi:hypothetical protein
MAVYLFLSPVTANLSKMQNAARYAIPLNVTKMCLDAGWCIPPTAAYFTLGCS